MWMFTVLQESESEGDKKHFKQLSSEISWFFFCLFVVEYVEDASSGLSFRLPKGLLWSVYVEVCLVCVAVSM